MQHTFWKYNSPFSLSSYVCFLLFRTAFLLFYSIFFPCLYTIILLLTIKIYTPLIFPLSLSSSSLSSLSLFPSLSLYFSLHVQFPFHLNSTLFFSFSYFLFSLPPFRRYFLLYFFCSSLYLSIGTQLSYPFLFNYLLIFYASALYLVSYLLLFCHFFVF